MTENPLNYDAIRASLTYKTFEAVDKKFCVFRYRNQSTQKEFTAVGCMLPDTKGAPVDLYGSWETNKAGRKQFKVQFYKSAKPSGKTEIVAFFSALHCGIGKAKAEAIWRAFGSHTWEIIENSPERLAEVPQISTKTVHEFINKYKENNAMEELLRLFTTTGVSLSGETLHALIQYYAQRVKENNTSTLSEIKTNPYEPYGLVAGYGFDHADSLASYLGLPPDNEARLIAAIYKVLDDAAVCGHSCLPKNMLLEHLIGFTGCDRDRCIDAIRNAFHDKRIKCANDHMFTPKRFEQEKNICEQITRLIQNGSPPITKIDSLISEYEQAHFTFADCQKDAIRSVFQNPFTVITGGPGVGKTTVTKGILAVHQKVYGASSEPILLAPTGKASRRMSEATGFPAQTIHSAVGWKGDDVPISENDIAMLDGNLVIVDEVSMMDQFIASMLFERIKSGTRVVLVGDIDQLPSVGCGNVLADLIKSGVIPTTRLTVIFRQAGESPIVKNAHKINSGDSMLEFSNSFRFIQCANEQEVFEAACMIYTKCVKAYGDDKVILLNPQRNNTFVSVDRFNTELQNRVNPPAPGKLEIKVGKTVFRENDKVMELKNCADGPKNGDVGYIREITRRPDPDNPDIYNYFANIEWNGDPDWIEYSQDDLRHVTLAFCTTVHKAQGAEYMSVIEVVSKAHPSMLKRNLVYTGITRAKQNVCLVGELDALKLAITNNSQELRYTLLASRLYSALRK